MPGPKNLIAMERAARKIIRVARKSSPLVAALFLPNVRDVLSLTTLRPQKEWYVSDLAARLHVRPSSLQRTLTKLVRADILLRRKDGNRVYYKADTECPIFPELAGIMAKTAGIADRLREALLPLRDQVTLSFVHGSVADASERSESDIDLVVVGSVSGMDLAAALRPLSDDLGRQVNPTRYCQVEFASKVADKHPFLSSVLRKPKIFVIGSQDELDQATESHTSRRASRSLTSCARSLPQTSATRKLPACHPRAGTSLRTTRRD